MSEIKSHGSEYLQETTTTKANPLLQDLQSPQAEIPQANFFRTPTISGRSSDLFTNVSHSIQMVLITGYFEGKLQSQTSNLCK